MQHVLFTVSTIYHWDIDHVCLKLHACTNSENLVFVEGHLETNQKVSRIIIFYSYILVRIYSQIHENEPLKFHVALFQELKVAFFQIVKIIAP